jgi:hypothetical protein
VSRGPGILQRRVCEVLLAAEGQELPLRELRRRLGEPDRSNLRRAIRGLLKRGLVEEARSGMECSVKLASWGISWIHTPPEISRSVLAERRAWWKEARELEEAREEEKRRLEAEGPRWIGYRHHFVRRRRRGPTQTRILSALWEYAEPLNEGLPVSVVKAIVGGDRSNTRRAIRMLLLRGWLDESEDGDRIRISQSGARWFSIVPPMPEEPIDDAHARTVLRACRVAQPARKT